MLTSLSFTTHNLVVDTPLPEKKTLTAFWRTRNFFFRDEAKSTFSVICENETQGRYIEKSTLVQLIEKDSSIAIDFIKMISNRYEQNITHSIRVILYRLQYNVIHLLFSKQANDPDQFFHLSITNEASMLGASTRSFRRILKNVY